MDRERYFVLGYICKLHGISEFRCDDRGSPDKYSTGGSCRCFFDPALMSAEYVKDEKKCSIEKKDMWVIKPNFG